MSKQRFKIAFIGSGLIAKAHVATLKKISDSLEITSCFNPKFKNYSSRQLSNYQNIFGKLYFDFQQWQNMESPDIVFVCTPPFARYEYEEALIKKNISYFVEKPPLTTNQDILIKCLKNNKNILVQIGYQWRFLKFNDRLVKLINDDEIGYIHAIRYSTPPFQEWKLDYKLSGGNSYEKAMHFIDYCEYILKRSVEPLSFVSNNSQINKVIEPNCNLPDTETLVLKSGNCIGVISTVSYSQGNDLLEINFVGKNNIYRVSTKVDGTTLLEIINSNKILKSYSDISSELYKREIKDFIKRLKSNKPYNNDDYYKSIETAKEILMTIKNGK